MRWRETSMGLFSDGKLHPWGDPISLLRYPGVGLIARLRYGLLAFVSTRRDALGRAGDAIGARMDHALGGRKVYERFWKPLFDLKFYEYADNISAAWIWTRVKRIGRSRKSLFQEELGYIEGGSQTLVDRLVARIEAMGGTVRTCAPVEEILAEDGRVTGVAPRRDRSPPTP